MTVEHLKVVLSSIRDSEMSWQMAEEFVSAEVPVEVMQGWCGLRHCASPLVGSEASSWTFLNQWSGQPLRSSMFVLEQSVSQVLSVDRIGAFDCAWREATHTCFSYPN